MTSTTTSESAYLAELGRILAEFGGREYSGPINAETRFFADLGLASIDAVVLGETLRAHYARPIPFEVLLADLGTRTDRDLSMGELAAFLARHLGPLEGADDRRHDHAQG